MTKKEKFIDFVENALFSKIDLNAEDPDIVSYWEALKCKNNVEKPLFTDNGKLIMQHLQNCGIAVPKKAKEIATEMDISSRTVAGTMRKLVADGFVEKIGTDPIMYELTENGRNIEIN